MKAALVLACAALISSPPMAEGTLSHTCYGDGQHCDAASLRTSAPREAEALPGWFYLNRSVMLARIRTGDLTLEWGFEPLELSKGVPLFWVARNGHRIIQLASAAGAIDAVDLSTPLNAR